MSERDILIQQLKTVPRNQYGWLEESWSRQEKVRRGINPIIPRYDKNYIRFAYEREKILVCGKESPDSLVGSQMAIKNLLIIANNDHGDPKTKKHFKDLLRYAKKKQEWRERELAQTSAN